MFSAGRDKNIYLTDLRQTDRHTLVCQEEAPVLKMILTPDQQGKPTVSRGFVSLIVFVVQCAKGVCVYSTNRFTTCDVFECVFACASSRMCVFNICLSCFYCFNICIIGKNSILSKIIPSS